MIVSRHEFLGGVKRRYETCQLPASGQLVRFQSMTAEESAEFDRVEWDWDENNRRVPNDDLIRDTPARLIIACLVDAEGRRLLSDADLPLVRQLDAADIEHLAWEIKKHCRLPDALTKKKTDNSSATTTQNSSNTD